MSARCDDDFTDAELGLFNCWRCERVGRWNDDLEQAWRANWQPGDNADADEGMPHLCLSCMKEGAQ